MLSMVATTLTLSKAVDPRSGFEGTDPFYSTLATQSWFREFDSRTQSLLAQARKTKGRQVKIAILDTGIALAHPYFCQVDIEHPEYGVPRDRVRWKSFVNGEGDSDCSGHGTHSAALLLKLAPKAKIYVAQVVEARSGKVEAETVAEVKVYRFPSSRGLP